MSGMIAINALAHSPGQFRSWNWLAALMQRDVDAGARNVDHRCAMVSADADDISRTLRGDGEAYRRIVRRYEQEIATKARRFSRNAQVIEELVQETFVEAYFSLRSYRGDSPLIHWLHRIAVRVGYRYWKSKKSHPAQELSTAQGVAAKDSPVESDDSEQLSKVLARLSPRDRLVVTLMYLEEHSVEETSQLTGWSKTMVKVQAFRARAKLRKMMSANSLSPGGKREKRKATGHE